MGGGPYYELIARHSGRCIEVSDNSAADNAIAIQYTCAGGLNQQWRLQDAGGGYVRVLGRHSGK
ncbi:RICIN domain-containing protein [Streptomyces sp. 3214.6]|uniref:RICIN domain-containing protein n=1 Tax=Streptomyces sp. 3214.6 TaxID=1882757 RepID=UPI001E2F6042|nr:RICIN domain-containing protein [Streptomyces sp. 3214.6]